MMWLYPLLVTVLVVVAFLYFLFTVEGENTKGIPLVFFVALVAVVAQLIVYGIWHLVRWFF